MYMKCDYAAVIKTKINRYKMATGGGSDMERGTDETFDFLCSVCKGKNKNTEGDQFCVDCHDYYCSTCVKCHNEIPVLKNHKILNKAQFKTSSGGQFPAVLTERCKVHKHKPVDMYCKQHDSVICSICMVNQHSGCHDKFYVPDYIKNNTDTANSNIADQLDTIANNLAELQDKFIKDKERLKSCKEKSLKQIQKYRKEINQMLDELEKKTINDLDQRIQSLNDKIEANLRELQATMSDVLTAQDSLKSARGNTAQTFVSIKMANAIVSHAQEQAHRHTSHDSSTEIDFIPHEKLQSILKEKQSLGVIGLTEILRSKATPPISLTRVTKTKTSAISSDNPSNNTVPTSLIPASKKQSPQSNPSLLKIKGKKTYTVKVNSDSTKCDIRSAWTHADGTVILADFSNNKLKRVNSTSYSVTDYCDVPNSPFQVCAITDQEVAVSCVSSQLIQFVSIGKTMQKTRKINTGFPCRALAFADEKLYVSDRNTSVYMYSVSGERQQHFSLDQSGEQIFSDIRSLAVSSDHSNIYVADYYKGLIILDRTGQLVGQFNGPELKIALGVCLYSNDSVLVCGFSSKNVLQFRLDGKLLGEVLKTDELCQAVCCNTNNAELIVCHFKSDEIDVHNINCE